ncbi:MAG TPA: Hsp70 family protein [Pyrinomonadaceae bacterium]|jgi:molecular chaperone DnaK
MTRTTVDFGIDLGTTNSTIGQLMGTEVAVIKNNEGVEYTPSAVYMDKNGALIVGRRAKERLESDPANAIAEFKLQMGTRDEKVFERNGRRMRPEELSAEVLKSLKADVRQRTGEDVQAAVITVPAAFELPQCEATNKAAQLAGIAFSPLLQEPVAAALAYGFQSESDKVFWLVFDLGGGTFDAAVIQVRDGAIQVVNHGGDNLLGGKLIDWAIVDNLLIPAVTSQFRLTDFRRGNPKWIRPIAKLKLAAEQAKIRVSRDESAEIITEFQDDRGETVTFEYDLQRRDVERMAEPYILRAINICRKVLTERRLGTSNVEKVLLVGGPTLMPYLRERLADRNDGLGITLEFSVDPLTVVARGAAIFAGTQRDERVTHMPVGAGQFALELEYKPVEADTDPLVGGRVVPPDGQTLSGYTIEFINSGSRPTWRSGKISLAANGSFITNLWAEKGKQNTFQIELLDAMGTKCEVVPDSMAYTVGNPVDMPLTHSIGVALANNDVQVFFEKGTVLPARKRIVQRQAFQLMHGGNGGAIKIPIVEGENKKADLNSLIGNLEILSSQVQRDVPAGSEIEVTIEIDRSRLVKTKAYIPVLDAEFEKVLNMDKPDINVEEMRRQVVEEKARLAEVREKVQQNGGDNKAQPILARIEDEQMMQAVENSLDASQVEQSAMTECQKSLRDLKAAIDELEDALEVPNLIAEARQTIEYTERIINSYGKAEDLRMFSALQRELKAAIDARPPNADELRRKIEQMNTLKYRVVTAQPSWWVDYLIYLEEYLPEMTDQMRANQLIAQGKRAINNNDLEGLKSTCRLLLQLLPPEQQEQARGYGGTTEKHR